MGGLPAAEETGLTPFKPRSLVVKGYNGENILDLAEGVMATRSGSAYEAGPRIPEGRVRRTALSADPLSSGSPRGASGLQAKLRSDLTPAC